MFLRTKNLISYYFSVFVCLLNVSHFINTRYQIMMRCWQNDPNARPTLTELRNQLKDMETQHKVRLVIIITKLIFTKGGSRLNHLPFVNQQFTFKLLSILMEQYNFVLSTELLCKLSLSVKASDEGIGSKLQL